MKKLIMYKNFCYLNLPFIEPTPQALKNGSYVHITEVPIHHHFLLN